MFYRVVDAIGETFRGGSGLRVCRVYRGPYLQFSSSYPFLSRYDP